ncbi:FepA family TonB-dependent siderophore receptor [Alloyangia pacifica]|uniref:Outer membrane receptor for ferrienterochelin and colicins n=1 Tax=Alloyangia pacifica TaxID=311180 RepID=A0A1I6QZV4_9RHOB|nr:FepA family TonB-dependent siderophore receptor [Alloyangia pacifica]SDG07244.1 outer membrane receptor for ferrienterochelin and colicins [Alloyangia pacifica]SFS57788.1 outer membrane receptor for ferrienterochelin and colicins [Alloyangia pacifica]
MASARARLASGTAVFLLSAAPLTPALAQDFTLGDDAGYELGTIVLTAEEQIKQALGTSTITAEDLEKQPVVNDVAEIIRKMPGVNLSGTSPSGQRGNQRQVDIRGMGPENVLILIDGKPVLSRTSVKMGRSGERDTRGDTNWVPAEMVERIEVIRGPAAARYGSGAAGGVVNIITKAPDEDLLQIGTFFDVPESSLEGRTQRYNLLWAKRLNEDFSLRFSGSYNKTDADDPEVNGEVETCETDEDTGEVSCSRDAGSEGVVNKDATLALRWEPSDRNRFDFELGWSRQGNLYAGDTQLGSRLTDDPDSLVTQLSDDGEETNVIKRGTFAITHNGSYGWGETMSYLQYERSDNTRLSEGPAGGSEGTINSTDEWDTALLQAISGKSEAYLDRSFLGRPSALTLGTELRYEKLDLSDYSSFSSITSNDGSIDTTDGDDITEQLTLGLYLEDNIEWTDRLTLTPSVRVDWADTFGMTMSGGLNASYDLTSEWTVKGGIAKAFKAPTLYQQSGRYVYVTRGNGCPYPYVGDGPCYVLGNDDLDPETSINTEIGVAYSGLNGINATLTYFHNDYRDKIQAGTEQVGTTSVGSNTARLYQWQNVPESTVEGLEGSFAMPLGERLSLTVNGTYMIESSQKLKIKGGTNSDGETYDDLDIEVPLSLVPDYTINASVTWDVNDKFSLIPSLTHYGPTEATEYSAHSGYSVDDTEDRDPYTLVNLAMTYQFDNGFDLKAGVTNLFNKEILRSGDGANTYNEPGRAYYFGLTKTF